MKHFATPDFWYRYRHLPTEIRNLADKNFDLLKQNPQRPSLRFKKVGTYGRRALDFITGHSPKNVQKDSCGSGSDTTVSTIKW